MYPRMLTRRATLCALLCGLLVCGWTQGVNAQGVAKAGTGRKGVAQPPGTSLAPQSTLTFSNSTPITIPDSGAATPYPSNITVAGFANSISTVRVRLNGVSHTQPGDIDILLVGPGGQKFILMSDAGAGNDRTNLTITFDDSAANYQAPLSLASGTFKPTNYALDIGGVCQDPFPTSAPSGPYLSPGGEAGQTQCGTDTLTSAFGGTNPNGTWSLYVVDDAGGDTGGIAGGWDLLFDVPGVAPAVGDLVISEMRFAGPGGGGADQFIEVQNVSNKTLDLSGLKLRFDNAGNAFSDVVINNGTFLLPGQHFLAAHSPGYSLGAVAAPDQTYNPQMICGVQLTLADNTVLDQVGRCSGTFLNAGEGQHLTLNSNDQNTQSSYVRKLTSGTPQDTNNNAADFVLVAVDGNTSIASAVLGAPGPENMASPIQRNATVKAAYIDNGCTTTTTGPDNTAAVGTCPRNRNVTPDPANNSDFGTLTIRRFFKNNTGQTITTLRFRIIDITTQNSPGAGAGQADLRARNSTLYLTTCVSSGAGCPAGGSQVFVLGTTLDAPTAANNGGLNTTLTVAAGNIAPGSGVNVQFRLGVKQTGSYRFFINVEALP